MIRALLAQPFLYVTVWLAICLQIPMEYVPMFLLSVLLAFSGIYWYVRIKSGTALNGYLFLIPLSLVFALRTYTHQLEDHPDDVPKSLTLENQPGLIEGIETSDSVIHLNLNFIQSNKKYHARIKIASDQYPYPLLPGDSIYFSGQLVRPSPAFEFDPFDYAEYLEQKHIQFLNRNEVKIHGQNRSSNFNIRKLAHQAKTKICHSLLSNVEQKEYGGLLIAILVGDKGLVSDRIKNQFIATGTAHILAVSGMHLGMLYAMLTFLMSIISTHFLLAKKSQTFIILILIWFFAIITGLSPAILRAAVMFSLLEFGIYLRRKTHGINILFGTAFLMIFHNPCILKDIGFQLSFMAVLSIMLFQAPINKLMRNSNKILNYLSEIIAVSLAVQFLITPISSFYFGSFPTYFLLTNLVWVPLSFILMILGIIVLITSSFYFPLSHLMGSCCAWSIQAGLHFFDLVEKWPIYKIDQLMIYPEQLVFIYSAFFCIFLWLKFNYRSMMFAALLFLLSFAIVYPMRIWKFSKESELVLYSKNKESVMDIRTGLKVFSFVQENQSIPVLNYYHQYHQIKEREIIRMDENMAYHFKTLELNSDSISWCINLNGFNDGLEKCTNKMLLVRNLIKLDSCMILDHQPDLVVLCKQNRTAIINQLTHFLSNENIPFLDMRTGTQLIKF
ncbi:MAG: ComEC/Rec2 family competence protein [Saprospiraceae bacterium]